MTLTMEPRREFDVVGTRVQRLDGFEKVTGRRQVRRRRHAARSAVGKILRSPVPHARIVRIDTSRAKKLPGVRAVVTAEDTPKRYWGAFINDQPILAIDKVRYVGEEVAAVAAIDEETADEALSADRRRLRRATGSLRPRRGDAGRRRGADPRGQAGQRRAA